MTSNDTKPLFVYLCDYKDLKEQGYFIKFFDELKDEIICFLDKKNAIKVFSSICPHFGGEIFYNKKNNLLKCKWHNWKYCTETGKCLSHPIKGSLNPYDFEINPDNLKVYSASKENEKVYIRYER